MSRPVDVVSEEPAAVSLLRSLYPPPSVITSGRRTPAERSFIAIPNVGRAKLLVPDLPAPALSRIVRRQLSGQRTRTRLARSVLAVAARTGALTRVPGMRLTVSSEPGAGNVEEPLRALLGRDDLRITMPVGPPRANRKPVLQICDGAGEVLGFAKVGHNELTSALVTAEAQTLRDLGERRFAHLQVPRVLGTASWQGGPVLVLSALQLDQPRLRGDAAKRRLLEVIDEVAHEGGVTTAAWGSATLRDRLVDALDGCGDVATELGAAVAEIDPATELRIGSWHGDLNPGNIALVDGRCPVWDWERFGTDVPVGFDLLHHDLHRAITVEGIAPGEAALDLLEQAPGLLAHWDLDPRTARTVARIYLVTLAQRYAIDRQADAGGALGRLRSWLVPALQEGAR